VVILRARYASHWAGTARGETAETEIDRRSAVAFSSAVAKIIAAGVTVRESIRHGNYRHDGNATAPTLARAVAVLLANSPYGNHLDEPAAQITLDLAANGHANHGWADYDVVA